jgi:hypothetical protein
MGEHFLLQGYFPRFTSSNRLISGASGSTSGPPRRVIWATACQFLQWGHIFAVEFIVESQKRHRTYNSFCRDLFSNNRRYSLISGVSKYSSSLPSMRYAHTKRASQRLQRTAVYKLDSRQQAQMPCDFVGVIKISVSGYCYIEYVDYTFQAMCLRENKSVIADCNKQ